MKFFRKLFVMLLIICLAGSLLSGCGNEQPEQAEPEAPEKPDLAEEVEPEKPFKVAALMPGPINDGGFNASCYEGIKLAEQELGAEIAYQENVPQSDFEESFRGYASQGFDVIIGHGFQFGDAAKKVALEFPDTMFMVSDSTEFQEPNMCSYTALVTESGFLGGVVAAAYSKSGKVAMIGGLSIPPVTEAVEGFNKGVKYVNPNVEALSAITGSFEDVAKAKEMAKVFIEQGADIVMHQADQAGLGVIEAAAEAKVLAIGIIKDQQDLDPSTVLVSALNAKSKGIGYMLEKIKNGDVKAQFYPLGIKHGVTGLIWNEALKKDKITPEMDKIINDVLADLEAGKIDLASLPE